MFKRGKNNVSVESRQSKIDNNEKGEQKKALNQTLNQTSTFFDANVFLKRLFKVIFPF